MRLVCQLDQKGCGVACLAMILGREYYEMRQIIDDLAEEHPDNMPRWNKPNFDLRLYPAEISAILTLASKSVECYFAKWDEKTEKLMILTIVSIDGCTTPHCVVYCGKTKRLLDPMADDVKNQEYLAKFNIFNCIVIEQE